MPIYELDGERPELPGEGNYYIADTAVLLNGARIGRNCIVGAGAVAVVTEGKEFAGNALIVGAPARVIRALDDKAVNMLTGAADWYVQRGKQYTHGLKRIG